MNAYIALYRQKSVLRDWPILEVIGVAAITAAASYLVSLHPPFQNYFCNQLQTGRLLAVSVSHWYAYSGSKQFAVCKHRNWCPTYSKNVIQQHLIIMDCASTYNTLFTSVSNT